MASYRCDVYDGQIWNDFKIVDGKPFLSSEDIQGIGFMLNVDWYQKIKRTNYLVGAVYLTIMNLRRAVRFKRKSVILMGILPGPSAPKRDINSYMSLLLKNWKTCGKVLDFV